MTTVTYYNTGAATETGRTMKSCSACGTMVPLETIGGRGRCLICRDAAAESPIRIDKAAAAVVGMAEKKTGARKILQAVHVRNEVAYAADGFMAGMVDLPLETGNTAPAVTIAAETIAAAVKTLPRPGKRDYVAPAVAVKMADSGVVLDSGAVSMQAPEVDGTYPDIESLFPRDAPAATVAVNPELLMKICKMFIDAGAGVMKLELQGKNQAIVFRGFVDGGDGRNFPDCEKASNADGRVRRVRAMLMPMVIGAE